MLEMLALIAAAMPTAWIAEAHLRLGLGEFPQPPIAEYLARSLSLFYVIHGAMLWKAAEDVERYRDLLRFWMKLLFAFSGVFLWIDWRAGMPVYWLGIEGPFVLCFSGLSLWWLRDRD